jgi:6-phosphogluconolactonase
MKTTRMARRACAAAVLAALTACGGVDSGSVAPVAAVMSVTPAKYTVGGTVTGLAGPGLVLFIGFGNGSADVAVGTSGSFTFGGQISSGQGYGVGIETQPASPPQYCQVVDGAGTIGSANVTNVQVTCGAGYTVGGTVSGLVGTGLVIQIENYYLPGGPGDPVIVATSPPVNTNGAFTLDYVYPSTYSGDFVSVTQPSSPTQHCVVENGRISIQSANDTSVDVVCAEFSYVTNAADNTLSAYRVDANTGALLALGAPTATGKSPYAVVGTSSKQFVYVGNEGDNNVSAFAVNVETGALTAVSGSPFAAGADPRA